MMKKRRMVLCALLLAMLMLGAAGADEAGAWVSKYPKAPESRLTYKVPDGVKADVEKSAGYISVTVKTAEMDRDDWKLVMIDGGYPYVNVQPGVLRPNGYETCMSFNGDIFGCVESDFFNTFANELANNPGIWFNNNDRHENGEGIGEIVADQCMFIPNNGNRGGGFFICWMDLDKYESLYPLPVEAVWVESEDNGDGGYYTAQVQAGYTLDGEGNVLDASDNIVLEAGFQADGDGNLLDRNGEPIVRHVFTAAEMKTNADGIFFYEYVETAVGIDTKEPIYVPFRSVSAAMMAPTKNASIPSGLSIKSIENGDITYLARNLTKTQDNVPVVFDAPEGAAYLVVYPPNHGSYKNVREEEWLTVSGDRATYYHQVHQDVCVSEEQLAAVWLDANKDIIDYGIFWFHVETPDYQPSGYYVKNIKISDNKTVTWYKPSSDRVKLINNCEATGVRTSYDPESGIFHISYDEMDQVDGSIGWVGIRVEAPEGATAARINHGGGNQIMGPHDDMASSTHNIIVNQSYITTQTVDDDGYITVIDMEPLRHYQAGPVDVYLQSGAVWPYGGGQSVIYWYADAAAAATEEGRANPLKIEYVADTTDVICVTSRTEIVDEEADITNKPVDNVTCVKPGYGGKDWHLVIHRYPQRGQDACHWEFYLENECGDYEPLDENEDTVIYMPYPDGHSYSEKEGCAVDKAGNPCTYEIYHYNSEYSACESLVGAHTPYGIKFHVTSMSPFVLDWGNFEGDLTPDQGEDDDNNNNGNNGNSRKYHLHSLRLDRGETTINGGRIKDVQLCTNALLTMKGGQVENLNIDFTDEIQQSKMTGGSVGTLFLVLHQYTPTKINRPALTVSGSASAEIVYIYIDEKAPTVAGQMVKFEGASPAMLIIEGDPLLYDPAWLGGASFKEVWLPNVDEPMPYDVFLDMLSNQ